ncbi:hypothetical protein SISNIDRAFT_486505 [Sistotremastrum niveocremeum HHB9708]|uniref:Uncharacterized protein n=1 Tax=Sistotremastrum niveocremeum HHB9708 TaxID=1314777 RepID=A0A164TLR7_9AGAM|nr:hypothetical protein SISNIDRAFT_486505 [Sistotremastrum niveocremeum HHB9708]
MSSQKSTKISYSAMHANVLDPATMSSLEISNLINANTNAVTVANRANQAAQRGDYQTAVTLHREALALKLKSFPETSIQASMSYNGIGEALLRLGDISGAEEAFLKALYVRDDKIHGGLGEGPRLDAAVMRENLAQVREAQGRFADAKELRLRGQSKGQICCANHKCPNQLFLLSGLKFSVLFRILLFCRMPGTEKQDWRRHRGPCNGEKERRQAAEIQEKEQKEENEDQIAPETEENAT